MRLESAQNHAKFDLLHSRKLNRIRAVFICSGAVTPRKSLDPFEGEWEPMRPLYEPFLLCNNSFVS